MPFNQAFAQLTQPPVLMLEPGISQGYLVINYPEYNPISSWVIKVYKNEGVDVVDYKLQESIIKRNTTYHKFDSSYFLIPRQYQYSIELYGENNQMLVSQGNTNLSFEDITICSGCGTYSKICEHKCNGPDYAYSIERWFHPNLSSSVFQLTPAINYFDNQTQTSVPYYEYMGQTQFEIYIHQSNVVYMESYRNIFSNDVANFQQYGYLANNKIIKISNPYPNTIYKDKSGNAITPTVPNIVYGVQKHLDKWKSYSGFHTPIMLYNHSTCSNNVQWASDVFNTNVDIQGNPGMPQGDELFCPGGAVPGGGAGSGEDKTKCLKEIKYVIEDSIPTGSSWLFWQFVLNGKSCLINIGGSNKKLIDITNEIQFLRIDSLGQLISITKDQILHPNGEVIAPDISLKKGLYRINFITDELDIISVVFEIEKNVIFNARQADFLTPTFFPVPIIGNQFHLKMEATAKVKFTYKLFDSFMNEIYSKNFVIQKDEERTHVIKPHGNANIPQGFLYNLFVFEDGSIKSMTTIK